MTIKTETSLYDFDFWSGAKDNAGKLCKGQMEQVEDMLEEMYPDGLTATEVNDLFWFDFPTILDWLGIDEEDLED